MLTDVGRVVDRYADDIFTTGRELLETLKGQPSGRVPQLTVGVADAVPKLVVRLLLRPATEGAEARSGSRAVKGIRTCSSPSLPPTRWTS